MDHSVLSLRKFSEEPRASLTTTNPPQDHEIQLLGGLLATSADSRSSRKRKVASANAEKRTVASDSMETSRSSDGEEAERAPQRGRPRLEARSQTRGERRRTQIRLAQRAYRQRKETTIAELSQKVVDLERTISEMSQIVADFKETAKASGLHEIEPNLAETLQAVALRFNNVASSTAASPGNSALAEAPNLSARTYSAGETRQIMVPANATESSNDGSVPRERRTENVEASTWGYVFGTEQDQDSKESEPYDTSTSSASYSNGNNPISDHLSVSDETHSLVPLNTKRMAPPSTYSFRESTFARRLLRAALERSYRVMMDPIRNEKIIQQMCKFVFCFNNFGNIRGWVSEAVARTDKESLELWRAANLHVGGAGLHYPRTSPDGDDSVTTSVGADRAHMLPRQSFTPQTPMPDWMTVDQIIQYTGFQGEWFDPNDVEQYLKSRGVIVDANSSWAELDVTGVPTSEEASIVAGLDSFSSSAPGTEAESSESSESLVASEPSLPGVGEVADASTDADLSTQFEPWSTSPAISSQSLLIGDKYSIAGAASKKILDVESFIRSKPSLKAPGCPWHADAALAIIEQAFCLGRTPGWRKEAIDSAIAASVHEAVRG
ncbi:MAG: hypothetical protein Q9191_003996 [Dirinaria sp. TL-2023a]